MRFYDVVEAYLIRLCRASPTAIYFKQRESIFTSHSRVNYYVY